MNKVCVAICNYNHQKYLADSIKSIVEQDHEDLDIVVVDDGSLSQPEVTEIVKGISDSRVRYIPLSENRGKWHALNTAFSSTSASICTSHDADDISLPWRISAQVATLIETQTAHNLCGFVHCFNEDDVKANLLNSKPDSLRVLTKEEVFRLVAGGYQTKGINHYFTGDFETAGVSSMFLKWVWDIGMRYNPPGLGMRIRHSEDSDFNTRLTLSMRSTSILAEKPYLYRRNTSTNKEET
jgi:glycosyltransferase involved in cell wall biosynthesis